MGAVKERVWGNSWLGLRLQQKFPRECDTPSDNTCVGFA